MLFDDFHKLLNSLQEFTSFPEHVARRLHALLGQTEMPVFADCAVTSDRARLDGDVIIFTETRVLLAKLRATPRRFALGASDSYSVGVTSWGRRDLIGIDMWSSEATERNSDQEWQSAGGTTWPLNASVSLRYAGDRTFNLPLNEDENAPALSTLRQQVEALGRDLASATSS